MSGDITLERGRAEDVFSSGRGYGKPSPRPGGAGPPEPAWAHAEDFGAPAPDSFDEPVVGPGPPPPDMGPRPPSPEPDPPPQEIVVTIPVPKDRVNLDDGTAVFMGHMLTLAPDAVDTIIETLAREVARTLQEEQQRVFDAVQQQRVRAAGSRGRQDVQAVPREAGAVDEAAPEGQLS